jgi:hypothetical protein
MSFVVAVLLMNIEDTEECFWVFVTMMEQLHDGKFYKYYNPKMAGLLESSRIFERILKRELGDDIQTHIASLGIDCLLFLTPWFVSLFTSLNSWETVLRIWDLFMLEGTVCSFRVALALLKICKEEIMEHDNIETLLPYMLNIPSSKLQTESLLAVAESFNMKVLMEEEAKKQGTLNNVAIESPIVSQ